ncbi:hypothetical protein [Tenuibacillus multivorans]|uniref:Uncharacterized protein n=1 Tax=Tenuibacillus multivorans TaxID=237069 RepID=A0A1G9X7S3_9BACI|nr:hypothetical protein [Tenuibacillus multivorans]GEL78670.1 hypothetical protein TMU01_29050 [Tenuibacillus multivorans]SDM92784.1 hypothetical protein SAMN05216498_1051 [Tenuibacillus multivorans]
MFEWMRNHRKLSIGVITLFLLFFIIIMPFVLNWIYYLRAPSDFYDVGYKISSILGYYGAVLTFIGTVSLGIITVYQNYVSHQKTNEINKLTLELQKKSMAMAEQRYEKEKLNEVKKNTPKFEIKNKSSNGHYMNLQAELKNVSNIIVSGIKSVSLDVYDNTSAIVTTSHEVRSKESSLSPGDKAIIEFHNDELRSKKVESGRKINESLLDLTIIWSFQCEDQFGNTLYFKAEFHIEDSKKFVDGPWEVQKVG